VRDVAEALKGKNVFGVIRNMFMHKKEIFRVLNSKKFLEIFWSSANPFLNFIFRKSQNVPPEAAKKYVA
jgi:hypothetical protein